MLIGVPPVSCATLRANSLACGMNVGIALAAAHQHLAERPEPGPSQPHVDVAVQRLHAEQDQRFPRPAEWMQAAHGPQRMPQQRSCQRSGATAEFASGPDGLPSAALRAGPWRPIPADNASPRYACARRGRCPDPMAMPFDRSSRAAGNADADQRFGIGAHAVAELVADRGQRAFLLQTK